MVRSCPHFTADPLLDPASTHAVLYPKVWAPTGAEIELCDSVSQPLRGAAPQVSRIEMRWALNQC